MINRRVICAAAFAGGGRPKPTLSLSVRTSHCTQLLSALLAGRLLQNVSMLSASRCYAILVSNPLYTFRMFLLLKSFS